MVAASRRLGIKDIEQRMLPAQVHWLLRHIAYVLLIAYSISASAWPFQRECPRRAGIPEGAVQAAAATQDSGSYRSVDKPVHSTHTCDHGCHIISHLLGQVSQGFTLRLEAAREVHSPASPSLSHQFPDNPFRPPRTPLPA